MASVPGRTTKIKRYYWREIFFAETVAHADWDELHPGAPYELRRNAHKATDEKIMKELKELHTTSPKYLFKEQSQSEVIARCKVKIDALKSIYAVAGSKGAVILQDGQPISPETFATQHYESLGWSILPLESRPFHALFGVMMWLLVQDAGDPQIKMIGFGNRNIYEQTSGLIAIQTLLPLDFGSRTYHKRRAAAIDEHFSLLPTDRTELLWLFDYWRRPSADFRQYLWAHTESDVSRARRLIEIVAPEIILTILRYLIEDYWGHYLGWPDLLLFRRSEYLLVEVKSSSDRLSDDQKRWITDNFDQLHIPFRIAKIHRLNT